MIGKEIRLLGIKTSEHGEVFGSTPLTLRSAFANLSEAKELPCDCELTATVDLSAQEASKKNIYLRLTGVVAKGEVYFNGKSLGLVGDANRTYLFNVADRVVAGENILSVKCTAPISKRRPLSSEGKVTSEYDTLPFADDIGIIGAVELLAGDSALINSITVSQEHEGGKVTLLVRTELLGSSDDVRAVASLISPSGKIYFGGASEEGIMISVPDPELWWPNGYGTQGLYRLTVTLYHEGEVADSYERMLGLRTIEYIPSTDGKERFFINGIEIFPMGGTYLPIVASGAEYARREEAILSMAKAANFNTVLVYDEGIAPRETFYGICDKLGIMVIQPLSLSYFKTDVANSYRGALCESISGTLSRFSAHTSALATYPVITDGEGGELPPQSSAAEEFFKVAMKIADSVIKNNLADVVFFETAEALLAGDERLISRAYDPEVNKLNHIPEEATLKSYLPEGEYNLFSDTAEKYIPDGADVGVMIKRTLRAMRFPNGMSELVYASAVASAMEASRLIRAARCEDERCMSAVLRPMNDLRFGFSPSPIDVTLRPKASYYALRSAFGSVIVNVTPMADSVKVSIKNNSKKIYNGRIRVALWSTLGKCEEESTYPVSVYPSETVRIEEESFGKYLSRPEEYYVYYELFTDKSVTERGSVPLAAPRKMKLCKPEIKSELTGFGKKYTLKLTSGVYVLRAYVEFSGFDAKIKRNYEDVLPEAPTVFEIETDRVTTVSELLGAMKITSAYDVGR